jgi:hypothetical protein
MDVRKNFFEDAALFVTSPLDESFKLLYSAFSTFSNMMLAIVLFLFTSICSAVNFPFFGTELDLSKRQDLVIGWALVSDGPCPAGLGRAGKRACCPAGSSSVDSDTFDSNLCCPGDGSMSSSDPPS